MDRSLDSLDSRLKPLAFELLARCVEARLEVIIINTLRTPEEQAQELASGNSWTEHSKHLPQPPDGKSLALDVCLVAEYNIVGANKLQWAVSDPRWQTLGAIGEKLGLRWGGRWTQKDMGHFELDV